MITSNNDFTEKSYEIHKNHHKENHDEAKMKSWTRTDTVDAWRHKRMYKNLDVLLTQYPNANWLTIGDGRYGTDGHYIANKGLKVLSTDISNHYLKIAKKNKYIKDYKIENVEFLTFKNEEFDFVLCKESYHHFPRPMIGLYEMLRVAKKGVVLIEPNDTHIITPAKTKLLSPWLQCWRAFKYLIKDILGKERYCIFGENDIIADYENVGNFVYSISGREIEKVALGLNLDMVVFKGINDYYKEGVEFEKIDNNSQLYNEVRDNINRMDKMCKKGLRDYTILVAMIFKEKLSNKCINLLKEDNFIIKELPKNPYINS